MVSISPQFNGPDNSGNGGYVSGLIAGALTPTGSGAVGGPVTTRLRVPPPLGEELSWEHDFGEVRLVAGQDAVVGVSRPGSFQREPAPYVGAERVEQGRAAYPGFVHHPFDRCFTCGTARVDGDGLRLFTGPIGDDLTAGPWHAAPAFAGPDGLLPGPIVWAALDCPGGWAADFTVQPMVLGEMTAEVLRPITPGETYHAVGHLHHRDGRKFFTDTALYTPTGDLLGRAEQIWIEIDIANFS